MLKNSIGLHNPNTMCYMNSSLQSLFSLKAFTDLLEKDDPLWRDLQELYKTLENANTPVSPKVQALFRTANWEGEWRKTKQEDANEYLLTLLSRLDGIYPLFNSLILDIPSEPLTLQNALATQTSSNNPLSPILWISLNRIQMTPKGFSKNNTALNFDETLEYYGSQYQLRSIIYHAGSLSSGHYTAACKRSDRWFWFDDSRVTPEATLPPTIRNNATPYMFFYELMA